MTFSTEEDRHTYLRLLRANLRNGETGGETGDGETGDGNGGNGGRETGDSLNCVN